MRWKRLAAGVLAAVMMLSSALPFAAAASPQPEQLPALSAAEAEQQLGLLSEENIGKPDMNMSIQLTREITYGQECDFDIITEPEDAMAVGVIIGTKGEARGYVGVIMPKKLRTLLELVGFSSERNLYEYTKTLVNGCSINDLLDVAYEVGSLMGAVRTLVPNLGSYALTVHAVVNLVRMYLPAGIGSRVYLDELPRLTGNYAVVAMTADPEYSFDIKFTSLKITPKSTNVTIGWNTDLSAGVPASQVGSTDFAAKLYEDGVSLDGEPVTYRYTGWYGFLQRYDSTEPPTQPGRYTQEATSASGSYNAKRVRRTIRILEG